MKELLGVVVGEDDPEIRLQLAKFPADFRRYGAHPLDIVAVFSRRHREELRGMRKHRPTNNRRNHGFFSPEHRSPRGANA